MQDTTDTAADKTEMVLMAKSRCQHYSGPWPPAASSAISPARIAAKPFLPYCGLPENEAVAAGDFAGVRYLASIQALLPHNHNSQFAFVFLLPGNLLERKH